MKVCVFTETAQRQTTFSWPEKVRRSVEFESNKRSGFFDCFQNKTSDEPVRKVNELFDYQKLSRKFVIKQTNHQWFLLMFRHFIIVADLKNKK